MFRWVLMSSDQQRMLPETQTQFIWLRDRRRSWVCRFTPSINQSLNEISLWVPVYCFLCKLGCSLRLYIYRNNICSGVWWSMILYSTSLYMPVWITPVRRDPTLYKSPVMKYCIIKRWWKRHHLTKKTNGGFVLFSKELMRLTLNTFWHRKHLSHMTDHLFPLQDKTKKKKKKLRPLRASSWIFPQGFHSQINSHIPSKFCFFFFESDINGFVSSSQPLLLLLCLLQPCLT